RLESRPSALDARPQQHDRRYRQCAGATARHADHAPGPEFTPRTGTLGRGGIVRQHHTGEITWFQFEKIADLDGLITHGVFSRLGGVSSAPYATLNAGLSVGDDPALVRTNRERIVAALPEQPLLVTTHPVHGNNVIEVTDDHQSLIATKADAMI